MSLRVDVYVASFDKVKEIGYSNWEKQGKSVLFEEALSLRSDFSKKGFKVKFIEAGKPMYESAFNGEEQDNNGVFDLYYVAAEENDIFEKTWEVKKEIPFDEVGLYKLIIKENQKPNNVIFVAMPSCMPKLDNVELPQLYNFMGDDFKCLSENINVYSCNLQNNSEDAKWELLEQKVSIQDLFFEKCKDVLKEKLKSKEEILFDTGKLRYESKQFDKKEVRTGLFSVYGLDAWDSMQTGIINWTCAKEVPFDEVELIQYLEKYLEAPRSRIHVVVPSYFPELEASILGQIYDLNIRHMPNKFR